MQATLVFNSTKVLFTWLYHCKSLNTKCSVILFNSFSYKCLKKRKLMLKLLYTLCFWICSQKCNWRSNMSSQTIFYTLSRFLNLLFQSKIYGVSHHLNLATNCILIHNCNSNNDILAKSSTELLYFLWNWWNDKKC